MVQTHQSAFAVCAAAGAVGVLVSDRHAAVVLRDARHLGVVADEIADFTRECLADHAHAADRLEHRGLEFDARESSADSATARDFKMSDSSIGSPATGAALESAARAFGVAAKAGGDRVGFVGVVLVERAPRFERVQQHFLVLRRDRLIELPCAVTLASSSATWP